MCVAAFWYLIRCKKWGIILTAERPSKTRTNFSKRQVAPKATDFSISAIDFDGPQLTQLAMDIKAGEVFCSWMVNGMDREQLKMVFIPLDKQELKPLIMAYDHEQAEDVVHVYQYVRESFFTKPSGYPSFKSCFGLKMKYVKPLMVELEKIEKEQEEAEAQ